MGLQPHCHWDDDSPFIGIPVKPPGVETTGDEHVGLSMTDDAAWTDWMRKCQMGVSENVVYP